MNGPLQQKETTTMTIEEVQARLRAAHSRIGNEGRFALTLSLTGTEECYITHWFRPDPHAFEDCKAVGSGTIAECLVALDRYTAAYRPTPTRDDVGRTLGILPAEELPPRPAARRARPRRSAAMMMAAE